MFHCLPGLHDIYYRDLGCGRPLVFLHGGWGYGVYPIQRQIDVLQGQVRFLIPELRAVADSACLCALAKPYGASR